MKKWLVKLAVVAIFFQTIPSFAWGTTGHRVVAEIAERNISKKTKKKITQIIGKQKLAYWANWPDFIKSDPKWNYANSYHYVNIPSGLGKEAFVWALDQTSEENLYKKGMFFIDQLKHNKNLSKETQQQYLYFIIHMIGDAHQPLHIGREEDLGGNKITVEWFKKKTNIHSLWDSKLIDFEQYSYTEYADVLDVLDPKQKKFWMSGSFADWIFDSYTQANFIYAHVHEGDSLGYSYHYENKERLEQQLTKGGLRLAVVLNDIFK